MKLRFIKIYNRFTNAEDEKKLTPDELFVYSVMSMEKNSNDVLNTSLDVLKHLVRVGRNKRVLSNKKDIIKCVNSLEEKHVIKVDRVNKEMIEVKFCDLDGGYEKLYTRELQRIRNSRELSIYVAIKKWRGQKNGAIYSYEQWSKILSVSRVSAIKLINQAVEDEMIVKIGTAYSSETGANNYLINKNMKSEGLSCRL